MLIRLSPEQIVSNWERFRGLFLENLIPKVSLTPEVVFSVLQSLITENMQLWAGVREGEGMVEERIFGFAATVIDTDSVSQQKNVLIYSIFTINNEIPANAWASSLSVLEDFRKENNCKALIAYSEIPEIISLAKHLGFKEMTFLKKE